MKYRLGERALQTLARHDRIAELGKTRTIDRLRVKQCGVGSYATVYCVKEHDTNNSVALKVTKRRHSIKHDLDCDTDRFLSGEALELTAEGALHLFLSNRLRTNTGERFTLGIAEAYRRCIVDVDSSRHMCMVMEYARVGKLTEDLRKVRSTWLKTPANGAALFRQLFVAVVAIAQFGVSHNDLKMDNVVVDFVPSDCSNLVVQRSNGKKVRVVYPNCCRVMMIDFGLAHTEDMSHAAHFPLSGNLTHSFYVDADFHEAQNKEFGHRKTQLQQYPQGSAMRLLSRVFERNTQVHDCMVSKQRETVLEHTPVDFAFDSKEHVLRYKHMMFFMRDIVFVTSSIESGLRKFVEDNGKAMRDSGLEQSEHTAQCILRYCEAVRRLCYQMWQTTVEHTREAVERHNVQGLEKMRAYHYAFRFEDLEKLVFDVLLDDWMLVKYFGEDARTAPVASCERVGYCMLSDAQRSEARQQLQDTIFYRTFT